MGNSGEYYLSILSYGAETENAYVCGVQNNRYLPCLKRAAEADLKRLASLEIRRWTKSNKKGYTSLSYTIVRAL